jgi:hypothetical protein
VASVTRLAEEVASTDEELADARDSWWHILTLYQALLESGDTLIAAYEAGSKAQLQSMITSTETAIGSFHSAVSIWAEEMEAHIVARDAETEGAASYAQTVTIAATVGTCCSAQFYLL